MVYIFGQENLFFSVFTKEEFGVIRAEIRLKGHQIAWISSVNIQECRKKTKF